MARIVRLSWLVWVLYTTNAPAATNTRVLYVPITPHPETIEVDVSASVTTSVKALDAIDDWDLGDGAHYRVARNPNDRRRITIQTLVANPDFTSLEILSGGHWYLFELRLARQKAKPVSRVIFVPTERDVPEPEKHSTAETNEEITILTQLLELTSLSNGRPCEGDALVVCKQRWTPFKDYGVLRFILSNRTNKEQRINSIAVHDEFGAQDRSGFVSMDGERPTRSTKVNATLASNQSVVLAVTVRQPDQMGRTVKVALSTVGRSLPTVMTIDLDPEPEIGEGLVTLSLQGIAGAVWLANPIEPSTLRATSTGGVVLRGRYGFNERLSLEGEIGYARSGVASWNDMTFDSQEGQIARDAACGRVLVGGLVHLGEKYRPLVRAGLGFQGVSHKARFTPSGGTEQAGPDVDFEMAGLWMVGLGFEAKLGEHWTAGLGATFVGVAKSLGGSGLEGSFEGGLHVSYGWTPQPRR